MSEVYRIEGRGFAHYLETDDMFDAACEAQVDATEFGLRAELFDNTGASVDVFFPAYVTSHVPMLLKGLHPFVTGDYIDPRNN